jgi:hypothetical protein
LKSGSVIQAQRDFITVEMFTNTPSGTQISYMHERKLLAHMPPGQLIETFVHLTVMLHLCEAVHCSPRLSTRKLSVALNIGEHPFKS